jgi:N-acetylmuramic acid 6-phosphate (MurNAc-6-P) etherase
MSLKFNARWAYVVISIALHSITLAIPSRTVQLSIPRSQTDSNLNYLSTEKNNALTKNLSSTMHKNCIEGLEILHEIDKNVLIGFQEFVQKYLADLKFELSKTLIQGGRCFLIGSGSSGRIAIDLAAKAENKKIIGLIAGGDCAFLRAREGFEDSQEAGTALIEKHKITYSDLVILISASGSASFNIGCAKAARKAGARVCYFYNSTQVPIETQNLFAHHHVIPILVDIGAQAIAGSTRLQAATLAELCLGCVLSGENPQMLTKSLQQGNEIIKSHFREIAKIILLEYETFIHPLANFRKLTDQNDQGYVTYLADKNALREIMIDTAEAAPTFSTNPPRSVDEYDKKKAEFQAFMLGHYTNAQAWQQLIGRELNSKDRIEIEYFIITKHGLKIRPLGKGNVVIGLAKNKIDESLIHAFENARRGGAKTALIYISDSEESENDIGSADLTLSLNNIKNDSFGLVHTIILKQVLNMISNGSMILMNKVDGNQMVDLNASNKKLIDRATRLVQDIFKRYHANTLLDYQQISATIELINTRKKEYDALNRYTPSPVKIAITMLHRNKTFEQAVDFLINNQENIEKVFIV